MINPSLRGAMPHERPVDAALSEGDLAPQLRDATLEGHLRRLACTGRSLTPSWSLVVSSPGKGKRREALSPAASEPTRGSEAQSPACRLGVLFSFLLFLFSFCSSCLSSSSLLAPMPLALPESMASRLASHGPSVALRLAWDSVVGKVLSASCVSSVFAFDALAACWNAHENAMIVCHCDLVLPSAFARILSSISTKTQNQTNNVTKDKHDLVKLIQGTSAALAHDRTKAPTTCKAYLWAYASAADPFTPVFF